MTRKKKRSSKSNKESFPPVGFTVIACQVCLPCFFRKTLYATPVNRRSKNFFTRRALVHTCTVMPIALRCLLSTNFANFRANPSNDRHCCSTKRREMLQQRQSVTVPRYRCQIWSDQQTAEKCDLIIIIVITDILKVA